VTPEEEAEYRLKIELLFGMIIQLTGGLMTLRKAVVTISTQPTLLLSQTDREEVRKEFDEVNQRIDNILESFNRYIKLGEKND
jgi:hypothetical protein